MGVFDKIIPFKVVRKSSIANNFRKSTVNKFGLFNNVNPYWINLENNKDFEEQYRINPVLSAVVNIVASFLSNANIQVRDLKTGISIDYEDIKTSKVKGDETVLKMFSLINNPNPTQSKKEFIFMSSAMKSIFGNSYIYALSGIDTVDIKTVQSLKCLWSQYMIPDITGKMFNTQELNDIINKWLFVKNSTIFNEFKPQEILQRKDINIELENETDIILGKSRMTQLKKPLSNIEKAYESRNVILQQRGMRGIISGSSGNEIEGRTVLDKQEKKQLKEDFKEGYGFLEDQNQFLLTGVPVSVTMVDQDVRKLGLFEEIAADAIAVANQYGVPEVLVKYYLQGATFENQDSSERRMYQGTTIPEANDFANDLSTFLNTREHGYEYVADFSHITVLQENEKDKASTNSITSKYYSDLFMKGGCTYNTWLESIGEDQETWGDVRIFQMKPEEIAVITGATINQS